MKKFSFLFFGFIFGLFLLGSNLSVFASGTPVATNVAITGTPNVGQTLTWSYTYTTTNMVWESVGNIWFSSGEATYTSLAIDSNNIQYVAYGDGWNWGKATVKKYNGTSWETVGSLGFSSGAVAYTNLAIDSNNIPYVAYYDGANSDKATVKKYNGTNWETVGSLGFSSGMASYISFVIDDNNIPYVSYMDGWNSQKASVMKYNGTNWEAVGFPGFSSWQASYTSLAIDSLNNLYILYDDVANSSRASVMKFNGTNWEAVGSLGFSSAQIVYTSLAIDKNNFLYAAYGDNGNQNRATVMKFNWTSREVVWVPDFSSGQAYYPSLKIDSNNVPYIAYSDKDYWTGSLDKKATVMKFNWTSWETVGVSNFASGHIYYNSLAISNSNALYLWYYDEWNGNKATVMKYEGYPEWISTYQWYGNGEIITGATWKTYNILSSDQGKYIKFEVEPFTSINSTWLKVMSSSILINTQGWGGWGGWWGWGWWTTNTGTVNTGSNTTGANNTGNIQLLTWNMSGFSQEFIDAYLFAYKIWITTQKTIQEADLYWNLTRVHMAKMMSNYDIKIMSGIIDTWRQCNFKDITNQSSEMKSYIKLSCQLGIMWVGMENFNPNWLVTRAEFGTVLSRILYGNKYNNWTPYYIEHLKALKKDWIITNIDPNLKEVRWYVMLMLMRATKIFQWE